MLENHAAELICKRRIEVAPRLFEIIEVQERLIQDPEFRLGQLIRTDRRFHATLVGATGNTLPSTLYESLGNQQHRIDVLAFTLEPRRPFLAPNHHRAIASALAELDLPAVHAALVEHLVEGTESYERLLPNWPVSRLARQLLRRNGS